MAADLVPLDADPLEDITNTREITAVVLKGRYLDRARLDALLLDAERAATAPADTSAASRSIAGRASSRISGRPTRQPR